MSRKVGGAESPLPLSGDALAALDAVADGFDPPPQRIPIPPHRAIPHTEVCEALASAAENNELPTPFFIRLIWRESGFNQNVISPAGAVGVSRKGVMMTASAAPWWDDPQLDALADGLRVAHARVSALPATVRPRMTRHLLLITDLAKRDAPLALRQSTPHTGDFQALSPAPWQQQGRPLSCRR